MTTTGNRFPVMEPVLLGNELEYVTDCIKSGWISSQGDYVKRFEKEFAELHEVNFALTASSGTTAIHLALKALDIGPGDEVIVPDLTFAATANAVIHAGACPVLADVSQEYWNLDPAAFEKAITPNTRAVIPVHLYGHPCEMGPILKIAKEKGLFVIEDCAEALGARYDSKRVGTCGDIGCFSFFSNKAITTGEGGMVITSSPELADKMLVLRDHGMRRTKRYWHEVPGFNFRMTNLQAALGIAQLEAFPKLQTLRAAVDKQYRERLAEISWIDLPPSMPWAMPCLWLFSMLIKKGISTEQRDALAASLLEAGIETRPFFYPLHEQPPYLASSSEFPVSCDISSRGLSLPSSPMLKPADIDTICDRIRDFRAI